MKSVRNILLRIPWRRIWWFSRWPWKLPWFWTRLCKTWQDASFRGNWSNIRFCLIDNPDLVCLRMTKALLPYLQVPQVILVKVHFLPLMHFTIICSDNVLHFMISFFVVDSFIKSSAFFPSFSGNRSGIDMSKCLTFCQVILNNQNAYFHINIF